jgi:hypothetical protein
LSATPASTKRDRAWYAILLGIVLVAALLRAWATLRLPLDYDEPVYLQAGRDYAGALRNGDLDGVIDYAEVREHPALAQLLYALPPLVAGQDLPWMVALYTSRLVSAILGVLAVLLLALLDPLAGGFLAVHTLTVKYTSQVYLEALPHLASLAAVLALTRCVGRRDRWFWLSALALGVTAAAKFSYLPVVLVILYLAIWEKRLRWHDLLLYGAVAVAAFWLLNPTLWHDPFSRLADSLFFHMRYSQGPQVQIAAYPWHRPLYWISRGEASVWHPDVFFYPALDSVIFFLALPGLYWEWRERRWVVVWIVTSLIALLLWPTKWPQYTLVLTPALCLAASSAARQIYRLVREHDLALAWFQALIPRPPRSFWILSGALVLLIAVIYTTATVQLTLGQLAWSHLTTRNSLLPSSTVYDLAPRPEMGLGSNPETGLGTSPDGGMVLGTARGVALWTPPETTDLPDRWLLFTTEDSPLPDDSVRTVAIDGAGSFWFGTEAGLARYDGAGDQDQARQGGEDWQVYRAADLGLLGDQVYAIAVGSDGAVWAGTTAGASVWHGEGWMPYTAATSGLSDDWVRALAIEPRAGGDRVWFGTGGGVSRLDMATGEWTNYGGDLAVGVDALLLDSSGQLWAGTLGRGLGRWDGTDWQFYHTGNSEIPFNTVTTLAEVEPGVLWIGTALPAEVGGTLVEFDGEQWKAYNNRNSGFSGAEPLAIARDVQGRWWIGTRTAGVDIYQAER